MDYPVESFTDAERALLEPHFTNLDRPVFALVNLPETVKGALFARYSRYPGTLRRLFLDEFAAEVPTDGRPFDGAEGERAAGLYERVFIGYGDDSIAQVGGAHVACEWVSNVLTKVLQRGRLAAYLEQSTRYIPYDRPMPGADGEDGGHRYYSDDALGPGYREAMDEIFALYSRGLEATQAWAAERWPRDEGQPERAWRSSIRAKALDLLRGLLPASTLSHVGIYASGQAYEGLLLRLAASPLPEARHFGELMLGELREVIPSFVARVERPDRGGDWVEHLRERRAATEAAVARLGLDRPSGDGAPSVELVRVDGGEDDLLAASLYESAGAPEAEIRRRIAALDPIERAELIGALAGERRNRRHRPGRGWEAVRYRFEIVSDYGGFRDLQRHRLLTCQWQRLGPELGAGVPEELREAGVGDDYERGLEISRREFERLEGGGMGEAAPYALCLGYRIRYVLDLNAREAMHLCELRSGREGHPTYRAVAQAMHERIAGVHPAVAAAMRHVDSSTEPRLERMLSEIRTHRKLVAASEAPDAPPGVSSLG
ncbi:MAG: thymidylate synthase [Solirubrobacterales bacterium]|nr:thymidylate synthase [Solirubrobacterales bacterium]